MRCSVKKTHSRLELLCFLRRLIIDIWNLCGGAGWLIG